MCGQRANAIGSIGISILRYTCPALHLEESKVNYWNIKLYMLSLVANSVEPGQRRQAFTQSVPAAKRIYLVKDREELTQGKSMLSSPEHE